MQRLDQGLRFRGKMLADIGARANAILCLVRIPIGTVPHSLAAFATAWLPTVGKLLPIGDLAVHLNSTLLQRISYDTRQATALLTPIIGPPSRLTSIAGTFIIPHRSTAMICANCHFTNKLG